MLQFAANWIVPEAVGLSQTDAKARPPLRIRLTAPLGTAPIPLQQVAADLETTTALAIPLLPARKTTMAFLFAAAVYALYIQKLLIGETLVRLIRSTG
jgi:hypothetical protein